LYFSPDDAIANRLVSNDTSVTPVTAIYLYDPDDESQYENNEYAKHIFPAVEA
jgi:hypothetical protein